MATVTFIIHILNRQLLQFVFVVILRFFILKGTWNGLLFFLFHIFYCVEFRIIV